jgi:putative transposase
LARNRLGLREQARGNEERTIQRRKDSWDLEAARSRAEGGDLAREVGVSEVTIHAWKSKYGGLEVSEAQRLRQLEEENRRLKHLVADLSLDKEVLKAVIQKNGWSSQLNGKM